MIATQLFLRRLRRLIPQAQAIWARAVELARIAARALLVFLEQVMDDAERLAAEMLYADRMAIRRMFLVDPRDPSKGYTKDGMRTLARLAKDAHAHFPIQTLDPILMAKAEGKRELYARILADLLDNMPDMARLMAQEDQRRSEEILTA